MNQEAVYKFHFDCRRMGTLRGVFIAEKRKVDYLISSGEEVYFGECLGKHSEIYGPVQACDVTMVTDNPSYIELIRNLELENGSNPVEIYEERFEEDHYKDGLVAWPWLEKDNGEET